jgi:hypothetical protein
VPAFVDRAPFGLGTYECGDEEAAAACEAITALLGDGLIAGATESNEGSSSAFLAASVSGTGRAKRALSAPGDT